MQTTLPWIIALISLGLIAPALIWLLLNRRKPAPHPLPTEWTIAPRPVFSVEERRVNRLLRDALPHHVVLAKLPLVRFCQPSDNKETRYWFDLLGAIHVGFAVCSPNGRVLAAIDVDADRPSSQRAIQIKQAVLSACRVRYLRCGIDNLPTVAELQLLVPFSTSGTTRGPQPAPAPAAPGETMAYGEASARRRAERKPLWQDSGLFQDSFFAPESRHDSFKGYDPTAQRHEPSGFGDLHQVDYALGTDNDSTGYETHARRSKSR